MRDGADRAGRPRGIAWLGDAGCRRQGRAAPDAVLVLKRPIRYQRMVGRLAAAEVVVCLPGSRRLPRAICATGIPPRLWPCHSPEYDRPMAPKPPESELVRLVMKDATEAEIAEATRRWFGYLQVLDAIVTEQLRKERDSRDAGSVR